MLPHSHLASLADSGTTKEVTRVIRNSVLLREYQNMILACFFGVPGFARAIRTQFGSKFFVHTPAARGVHAGVGSVIIASLVSADGERI